jgi:hypothetical protein
MKDKDRKRKRKAIGIKNKHAKLTEKQIIAIRKSRKNNIELSKKYNVNRGTIWSIKNYTSWTHIP